MIDVGIARGTDSYKNVREALEKIKNQVVIPDRPVLIKPNFVTTHNQLAATPLESTVATLEFLNDAGIREFIIAAGPAVGDAKEGFTNYRYDQLVNRFNIKFLDLNVDQQVDIPAFDERLQHRMLGISKTMMESWVVSVCPMKTHDTVVVTLGLKNVLVGGLRGVNEKRKIHQGYKSINLTLAKMAQYVAPGLTVIDGTIGMQGDGPIRGFPINSQVTLASAHPFAADVIALKIMGFELKEVGYLRYCMELNNLSLSDFRTIGHTVEECKIQFQPHSKYKEQLKWEIDSNWVSLLR